MKSGSNSFINKAKKYGLPVLFSLVALLVLVFVVAFLSSSNSSFRQAGLMDNDYAVSESSFADGSRNMAYAPQEVASEPDYLPPQSVGYVPNLEAYETTDYSVSGRIRDLGAACGLLNALKVEDEIYFKYLSENKNACSATFFVDEAKSWTVIEQLRAVDGADVSRITSSVTRQRSQLKSRTVILEEQLASVERTLLNAERQYEDITEIARASNDASALTVAIRDKLQSIDSLTQRRIQLTSQLQNLNQQASDLEERIGVVSFTVSFSKTYIVDTDRTAREWEAAWKLLKEEFTAVLIGFTAYLGIFLLRLMQFVLYGLILLVVARIFWKVVRKIWKL